MDETHKEAPREPTLTNRESVVKMLSDISPGIDFTDEDTLFGRIIDDYGEYARLLTEHEQKVAEAELKGRNARIEELMNTRIAPPQGADDGLPHLSGASPRFNPYDSIFTIARDA